MQNYRLQAEGIALEAFSAFGEAQKEDFLVFLKQTFPKEQRTIRFLENRFLQIKDSPTKIPRHHAKVVLEGVLHFLPTQKQSELLRLEALDIVETFRQKITKKTHFTVDEAFELYTHFLEFLYQLHTYPTWWFRLTCSPTDWQEVAETVKFITITQLRASALHFKKDLQIIAENSGRISAKILYEVDFLRIKVHIKSTQYSLERLYAFDEYPIPVLVGKFSEFLKAQIFEALHNTAYQLATQQIQKGLLEHDLKVALEHYKQSNPIFNKIDFSFKLQGGAGAVSMDIRTWASVGKRVLAPLRNFVDDFGSISVGLVAGSAGLVAIFFFVYIWTVVTSGNMKDFISFSNFFKNMLSFFYQTGLWLEKQHLFRPLLLGGLTFGGYHIYKKIRRDLAKINRTQETLTLTRSNGYSYAVTEKKRVLGALKHSPEEPERIYYQCLGYIREESLEKWRKVEDQDATHILMVYENCHTLIKRIFEQNVFLLSDEAFAYIQPLKYLIFRRLKASLGNFVAFVNAFAKTEQDKAHCQYYLPFLGIENKEYVASFHRKSKELHESATRQMEKNSPQIAYPIIEDKKMQTFIALRIQEIQNDSLLEELAQMQEEQSIDLEQDFFIDSPELLCCFVLS
ncbi:MAG: hypothetical protein EAZ95_07030 [Bacteroidetes bacterium]|nr:MAG: hypothetical protein EAZ95_07030 [Bacteroidota bacterium]